MNRISLLLMLIGTSAMACSATPSAPTSDPPPIATPIAIRQADVVHLSALRHGETSVSMTVEPGAACQLVAGAHPASASKGLWLASDERGAVHWRTKNDAPAGSPVNIQGLEQALACRTESGSLSIHPFVFDFTDTLPLVEAAPPRGIVRPALVGDPMGYSPQEIAARHLPARPDPIAAPEAYARWLHHATTETRIVESPQVTLPKHASVNQAKCSDIWAGYELFGQSGPWVSNDATWFVPNIHNGWASDGNACANTLGYCEIETDMVAWVGMDGTTTAGATGGPTGNTPLIQAGTESDWFGISIGPLVTGDPFNNFHSESYSYSPWIEYFPDLQVFASGLNVSPGDSLEVIISTDSGAILGQTGYFDLWDQTTGIEFIGALSIPQNALPYAGTHAQWIVERPATYFVDLVTNQPFNFLQPLSQFDPFGMSSIVAQTPTQWGFGPANQGSALEREYLMGPGNDTSGKCSTSAAPGNFAQRVLTKIVGGGPVFVWESF